MCPSPGSPQRKVWLAGILVRKLRVLYHHLRVGAGRVPSDTSQFSGDSACSERTQLVAAKSCCSAGDAFCGAAGDWATASWHAKHRKIGNVTVRETALSAAFILSAIPLSMETRKPQEFFDPRGGFTPLVMR